MKKIIVAILVSLSFSAFSVNYTDQELCKMKSNVSEVMMIDYKKGIYKANHYPYNSMTDISKSLYIKRHLTPWQFSNYILTKCLNEIVHDPVLRQKKMWEDFYYYNKRNS